MRRNLKLIIQYDGTEFAGWQRLRNKDGKETIQGIIEDNLTEILCEPIKIIGSGRTDQGVHALGQVANFHTKSTIYTEELKNILNQRLPETIVILLICDVNKEFHSRHSAKSKTYEYHIDRNEKASVFTRRYTYHHPEFLNVSAMKKASEYLVGVHDFRAFSTLRKDCSDTVREIYSIHIEEVVSVKSNHLPKNHKMMIRVNGNGFLYNMVRIIVGTLIEVGEEKKNPEDIKSILSSKKREKSGKTAEYQGLILKEVEY